jgi:outer membrane protein OmpA-like peptidoglycan-associated protein
VALHFSFALVLGTALASLIPFAPMCLAQENPNPTPIIEAQPTVQAADCPNLPDFPQLAMSVVVSCQKSDSVEVKMPLKSDGNGVSREKLVRGIYEFREYRIPRADQQEHAFENLMQLVPIAGFIVRYSANPSTITAQKGDTWILINISGDSYNVSVVRNTKPPCSPVKNAEEISREFQAHNRVAIYGIQFSPENQSIQEQNSDILNEVLKFLVQNPAVAVVIESHKFSALGTDEKDSEITRERANAVFDWLVAHGVAARRLQARPFGRNKPLEENDSPMGNQCNERIELSK